MNKFVEFSLTVEKRSIKESRAQDNFSIQVNGKTIYQTIGHFGFYIFKYYIVKLKVMQCMVKHINSV